MVIIPAFNEAVTVDSVISEVLNAMPEVDIAVIDDGSDDDTATIARQAGAIVISHPFNLGYGCALQTGYKYAFARGYRLVAQMDADGQHDAGYLSELFSALEHADIVIGSRFLNSGSGGTYRAGIFRRTGMIIFSSITSLLIGQSITDPTSGFIAMQSSAAPFLVSDDFPYDYPDADVLIMLHRQGLRICEAPTPMYSKSDKKSLHSGMKPAYYVFKMFLSILMTMLRKRQ